MLTVPNPEKSRRVMQAMLQVKKVVMDDLKRAY
jgi:hypothetical protein